MIIRRAKKDDFAEVLRLGREMHEDSYHAYDEFVEEDAREWFESCIKKGLGIVAEYEGKLIGMLGAGLARKQFSNALTSWDELIYVTREFRGGRTAERMIKIYIMWAKEHGVKAGNINLGINAGGDIERIERFYRKLGFRRSGVNMTM